MFRACFKKYDGRVWSNQKETIDYVLVAIQVAIWNEASPFLFIYLLIWDASLSPDRANFNISFACNSTNNAQNVWQKMTEKAGIRLEQRYGHVGEIRSLGGALRCPSAL